MIGLIAMALAARWPLLPYPGFLHDQDQFVMWAHVAATKGVAHVYDRPAADAAPLCNYPPVQVYICRALASIFPLVSGHPFDAAMVESIVGRGNTAQVRAAYVLFKLPAVLADLATAALLLAWISRRSSLLFATIIAAIYALHPAVLHDSSVWGQIDAIPTLFILCAFEAARRNGFHWMWAWAALAALTKPQSLIFLPVWLTISILNFRADGRQWLRSGGVVALIVVATVAPFYGGWDGVWEAYVGAASYYPFTHLNGFSAWFLKDPLLAPQLGGNLLESYARDDRPLLLGITPRVLGLIGVFVIWLAAVQILRRRRGDEFSLTWAARLVPLGFFVVSTQMHERYLYPAIAIWAWTARPDWRWWVGWLLLGACVAVNMLWVWIGPCAGDFLRLQEQFFHRPWLGQPPGVWCSVILIGLLLVTLFGGLRAAKSR
jgi:dolichyl-phosphate-mannose-protein mannosyltransferase